MTNIDNMLKKVLGKGKAKRQSFGNNINKILGKSTKTSFGVKSILGKSILKPRKGASFNMQQKWKSFNPMTKRVLRKRLPDTDGDRVPNIFDCQPYNYFKQDIDFGKKTDYNETKKMTDKEWNIFKEKLNKETHKTHPNVEKEEKIFNIIKYDDRLNKLFKYKHEYGKNYKDDFYFLKNRNDLTKHALKEQGYLEKDYEELDNLFKNFLLEKKEKRKDKFIEENYELKNKGERKVEEGDIIGEALKGAIIFRTGPTDTAHLNFREPRVGDSIYSPLIRMNNIVPYFTPKLRNLLKPYLEKENISLDSEIVQDSLLADYLQIYSHQYGDIIKVIKLKDMLNEINNIKDELTKEYMKSFYVYYKNRLSLNDELAVTDTLDTEEYHPRILILPLRYMTVSSDLDDVERLEEEIEESGLSPQKYIEQNDIVYECNIF